MARSKVGMTFKLNPAGFAKFKKAAQTGMAMERIATKIANKAEANGDRFTKGYDAQRRTVDGTAGARAGTDYPFAHFDEWGTIHRTPKAPLRRALSQLGLYGETRFK